MDAPAFDAATTTVPDALTREIAATASQAAERAGAVQMAAFRRELRPTEILPRDVKTDVDRRCEAAIVACIRECFPDHQILSEEGGFIGGRGDFVWIIDPLDGTVNFVHGLPQFCTCVACCRAEPDGQLPANGRQLLERGVAGAVFSPATGERYVAVRGCGATVNDRPLHCADTDRLSETIVALSFGKTDAAITRMTTVAGRLARNARKVRSYGCAGMDILQVAHSRLGGVLYQGIELWDLAAAGIVLAEAGGLLQAERQTSGKWNLTAALPGVARELQAVIEGERKS